MKKPLSALDFCYSGETDTISVLVMLKTFISDLNVSLYTLVLEFNYNFVKIRLQWQIQST